MNRSRRKDILSASHHIERAIDIIRDAKYEEQYCLDNTPENLQNSDRYDAMENSVENLEDAISSLEEAQSCVNKAIA